MKIPEKSMSENEILEKLEGFREKDLRWRSGKVLGYVYYAGKAAEEIGKKAYMMYLTENGLDPTSFPSLMQMENEIVAMAAGHVNGDSNVVGNFTSGGTESILMAVKTARDHFRVKRPEITVPEMLMPTTAHAAFHKAAKYFDVKVVLAPVDGRTFKAEVEAMRRAITPNTILMVGSAPSYAHGVVDPIPELAQLARENDLLFHTDACVGGFMLPYLKRLGEFIPDFGFDVPGVTSLSMDLHKYGYKKKNASLVLYRDKSLRRSQIFACANWPGYTIINSAAQSSKTGGPLAAAWAVLNFLGDGGYNEIARQTLEATRILARGIDAIDDLQVVAEPDMFMFAVKSDTVNVFHVIDEMKERGWYIQPQLQFDNSPKNFHISVSASNIDHVDELLETLRESVRAAKGVESGELVKTVREALSTMNPEDINADNIADLMAMAGVGSDNLPERMADINDILNSLAVDHRELMLIEFLNDMFHYQE
ncbi:MAG: aspartate aminotransferase family protein [Proteobacteria bacterium]|nr:aspartate aminotransferase family protein [Pseudomonadota bacterium]